MVIISFFFLSLLKIRKKKKRHSSMSVKQITKTKSKPTATTILNKKKNRLRSKILKQNSSSKFVSEHNKNKCILTLAFLGLPGSERLSLAYYIENKTYSQSHTHTLLHSQAASSYSHHSHSTVCLLMLLTHSET